MAIVASFSGLAPRAILCRPFRASNRRRWRSLLGSRGSRPELYYVALFGLLIGGGGDRCLVLGARARAILCRPFRASNRRRWRSLLGSRGSRAELYDVALFGLGAKSFTALNGIPSYERTPLLRGLVGEGRPSLAWDGMAFRPTKKCRPYRSGSSQDHATPSCWRSADGITTETAVRGSRRHIIAAI